MDYGIQQKSQPEAPELILLSGGDLEGWLAAATPRVREWVTGNGFKATGDQLCPVPGDAGGPTCYLVGTDKPDDPWALADLPMKLPPGPYRLARVPAGSDPELLSLGWSLGCYGYHRYKAPKREPATLVIPDSVDLDEVRNQAAGIYLTRDLVNAPAEDMMPEDLGMAAETLAHEFGAEVRQIVGDDLLREGYPTIHRVGRASAHAPRLIELRWGDPHLPRLTLVGKGVCFDTGGLNLKGAGSMRLMKKDMGGAANVLGLARMIMGVALPVHLRVLIGAVENAVGRDAYRPGDVIRTRKGLTVEVDNTDAEGRLVLCDALTAAAEEKPRILLDFATLTGAARVALGPDLPALFCQSDELAEGLLAAGLACRDPLWRMPLHQPYRSNLDSAIADLVNSAESSLGGAIHAALFLQAFVPEDLAWAHIDLIAWNLQARPGRPAGGEAMGLRAALGYLRGAL